MSSHRFSSSSSSSNGLPGSTLSSRRSGVRAGRATHDAAPFFDVVPGEHGVHAVAPAPENVFLGHLTQDDADAPLSALREPAGHASTGLFLQNADPGVDVWERGHGEQIDAPAAEK